MRTQTESQTAPAASPEPQVSVIVPTHNRPEMLRDALTSVLQQTLQDFEIIVVNDAGTDVTSLIEELRAGSRIRHVRHHASRGPAAARNTGLRMARGRYIAYLDDDDIYYPDHLATLVQAAESERCAVVYSDARRAWQERVNGRYAITRRDQPYSNDFDPDALLVCNQTPTLCMLHERACLERAGYFDEHLGTHEDWDLWIRLSRHYRFAHVRKVTCEFRWREEDQSSLTQTQRRDFLRTMEMVYERYADLAAEKPKVLKAQRRNVKRLAQQCGLDTASSGGWLARLRALFAGGR